jgi:hypothetical protein
MNDLTLIYLSASLINPETQRKIAKHLLETTKDQYPCITIIQGFNYPRVGSSPYNYYKQFLEGCYKASTEFVATCEDDTLYPSEHFTKRPPEGFNYAYNANTWLGGTSSFGFYISRRLPLIELLENRFKVYPEAPTLALQRHFHEPGVFEYDPKVEIALFTTLQPIIAFEHRGTLSGKRKRFGDKGITTLPFYGNAHELYEQYWAVTG